MPSRSPTSRRSTPPPTRMARRSAFRSRERSPERRRRMAPPPAGAKYAPRGRGGSPSRGRDRREFRESVRRRSRSPLQRGVPKQRSFSPSPVERKMSPVLKREPSLQHSQERERERIPRKRSRTKSPPINTGPPRATSRTGSYSGGPPTISPTTREYPAPRDPYAQGPPPMEPEHRARTGGERFRESRSESFEKERPRFRGPEGKGYNIDELKKITVDIRRNLPVSKVPVERGIVNPEDVVLVRRPESGHVEEFVHFGNGRRPNSRRRGGSWDNEENHFGSGSKKREGSRPIFAREEIMQAESERAKYSTSYTDTHQRVVEIHDHPPQGSTRYESPGRYTDAPSRSRDSYRPHSSEREPYTRPSHDYDRQSSYDRRRDDLRHELDTRRRDDSRYGGGGGPGEGSSHGYERRDYHESDRGSSDLRKRIIEKRTDRHDEPPSHRGPSSRIEDHSMMQPSPPGERRRGPPMDSYSHSESKSRPSERFRSSSERFHQKSSPEFSQRRETRYEYKTWNVDPEYVPKGRAYFEHDNREDEMVRGMGRGRGIPGMRGMNYRGRGMQRGRPFFRGSSRGFMPPRGMGRRGYAPRFPSRPRSPHWEHDMFDKLSPDEATTNGHGK